ncbi:MAG: hypothetical protein KDI71_09005 [Xanthomonadales bacterium]|nr:hypothetical protein [Xanthomonadales bacterium]
MIDRSKLSMRGRYGIAVSGAVTDHVLLAVATEFENTVMRKIAAVAPTDLASRFAGTDPLLVTHKYDGEGVLVYYEDGQECFAFSAPSGRARLGLPALDLLASKLKSAGVNKALLRCELYLDAAAAADGGRRAGVSEVIRVSFSGSDEDLARLRLAVIDAVMIDGKDLRPQQAAFAQTMDQLTALFGADLDAQVHTVAAEQITEDQVPQAFERHVAAGAEGVVIRRLNRAETYKVKPIRSVDALIIGFVEGEFEGQFGISSLLTALCYEGDGDPWLQAFSRVGSGLTDAQRVELLDQLRPLQVSAPLAMTDSSGREVQFIKPRLVLEMHGEDLVHAEGGREQRTQLLSWNEAQGAYEFLGLTACPRLSFARFRQIREDKDWRQGGARISQILDRDQRPELRPATEQTRVIRREVYAKGEMLRKLVVVHKAGELSFPYLIYWTDYSAKRAEPLKVTTDLAASEERAMAIAEKLLEKGLTKGFVPVGAG